MNTITVQIILIFLIGLILVHFSIPIIVSVSKAKHLYDEPNERKVHKTKIPNLGGVALFIGISIATLLGLHNYSFPDLSYIMASMIIVLFVGIKDDIMTISVKEKLLAQLICALILIIPGDIRVSNLHGIFGIYEINYLSSVVISILGIVAIINSINLVDGIDGLAAGIGILITCTLGVNFILTDNLQYAFLCFAIAGSLTSFFIYNVFGRKNKIFMGDTGSLLMGLLLAVIFIKYNEFCITENEFVNSFSPILSLAIFSVPVFDMIRVFFIRVIQKKSPFSPDNNHIHHKLLLLGYSHIKSTFIIIGTNLVFIAMVYSLRTQNNNFLLMLLGSTVMLSLFLPGLIYRFKIQKISEKYQYKNQIA